MLSWVVMIRPQTRRFVPILPPTWTALAPIDLSRLPRALSAKDLPRALRANGSISVLPLPSSLLNIPTFKPSNVPTCSVRSLSPLCSKSVSQLLCPQAIAHSFQGMPGCTCLPRCPSPAFRFAPFDELSPFFSTPCELFCAFLHFCKIQLLCFHTIPHSLAKTRGVGVSTTPVKGFNPTPPTCVFSTLSLVYPLE